MSFCQVYVLQDVTTSGLPIGVRKLTFHIVCSGQQIGDESAPMLPFPDGAEKHLFSSWKPATTSEQRCIKMPASQEEANAFQLPFSKSGGAVSWRFVLATVEPASQKSPAAPAAANGKTAPAPGSSAARGATIHQAGATASTSPAPIVGNYKRKQRDQSGSTVSSASNEATGTATARTVKARSVKQKAARTQSATAQANLDAPLRMSMD